MEGVSEEANEIYLELAPENLVKALKTAQSAKWIKIKLAKKHTPCLTVEVDLVSTRFYPFNHFWLNPKHIYLWSKGRVIKLYLLLFYK